MDIVAKTAPKVANVAASANAAGKTCSSAAGTRRVTLMCVAVALCFTVTALPQVVNILVMTAGVRGVAVNINQYLITLRTLNACIDPIIYGLMWRPFRISLSKVCTNVN